ncbi:MAG: hypothetical protein AB7F75_02625 [Planctomycetota bacterium]
MSMLAVMGMGPYEMIMFGLFVAMLGGLLVFHHHKNLVVTLGFLSLSGLFINHMGDIHAWVEHFGDEHRRHLLVELALLLPAFALVAYYFEHSGASHGLAQILRRDSALLWSVFVLSTVLDNIAAALIGATILLAKYGKDAPFRMIVGIIGASNLGGAGSPVGDTTTVMMFISKDPKITAPELFMAFIATVPAMFALTWWAVRHGMKPQSYDPKKSPSATVIEEKDVLLRAQASDLAEAEGLGELAGPDHRVHWKQMWPILAIPGLVIGNTVEQVGPGIGVWAGLILGLVVARLAFNKQVFKEAVPNMLFLVTLVATAELLPLDSIKPSLEQMPAFGGLTARDMVALMMGHLSAWFDNIPLTAICLQLKGFDWGLLAYCVGYGGSAMWFGSSAGVAIGLIFPQTYDTKRWGMPFVVITLAYWVGAVFFHFIEPHVASMVIGHPTGQP